MKKNAVLALLALAGAIIGYIIRKGSNASDLEVITDILFGAFLFWHLGRAFFLKLYVVLIGPICGLLISIGSDLLAGSEVAVRFKLMYMTMGLFAGWPFWKYRKPFLVGGIVGGVIGFIWGLIDSHLFGNVRLPPGILNALLLAVQIAMIGMSFARLFAEFVEQKFMVKRNPPS